MLDFENLKYAWLFLAIPFFILIFIFYIYLKKRNLNRFGDMELVKKLTPDVSFYKPIIAFVFLLLAFSSLVVALMNPRVGTKLEEVTQEGVEIMIILDVSNSMNAQDVLPSRLERSKQLILRLIDNLRNDKIGLVVFAGIPYLQLPMTTDFGAAKLLVSTVSSDIIQTQGTAIGSAINLAVQSFSDDESSKVIIIITDGENHEDDALGAVSSAYSNGISVHSIGMGSTDGAPIPLISGNSVIGYLKDTQGNTVLTKVDQSLINQLANAGGGIALRSTTGDINLSQLIEEIQKLDKTEFETKIFTEFESKYQIFLGLALAFLLINFIFTDKKNRFIVMLNNFVGGKK